MTSFCIQGWPIEVSSWPPRWQSRRTFWFYVVICMLLNGIPTNFRTKRYPGSLIVISKNHLWCCIYKCLVLVYKNPDLSSHNVTVYVFISTSRNNDNLIDFNNKFILRQPMKQNQNCSELPWHIDMFIWSNRQEEAIYFNY